MANKILPTEGWEERIRDKLGVDPAYVPDEAIKQPDIIDVAEANIIAQIPNYTDLTGDKKTYLEAAVVCECCVLLCPSMAARLPAKEQGPHEGHTLYIDWDKKKAEFAAERDGYIGKIIPIPFVPHFGLSR